MSNDRRIRKTQAAITQATVLLLSTTPIRKLTVKEICAKADISRSTFYLHYYDASDVIEQLYNDISVNVSQMIDCFDFTELLTDPRPFLERIVEFVLQNISLYRQLMQNDYHSDFRRRLKALLQQKVYEENYYRFRDKTAFRYMVCYTMAGLVETICENMEDLATERCALLLDTMTTQMTQGFNLR